MSSGTNAPRKANAATTLFKASSRFLHGGAGNGQGAGGKNMKRQRAGASLDRDMLSAESNNSPDAALDDHKDSSAGAKCKKRFVGVRQRPSGRWVAEIKDTTQKIRLWLGTFDSAEEGAKAYDSAARALRGANTRTNFVPAMACEGTVPASKAARLIRLRQIAAASKANEKEAARNAPLLEQKDVGSVLNKMQQDESKDQVISPLVRQDFQQSSSPSTALDDSQVTTPHLPSSTVPASAKSARLIGRRNNVSLASAKAEQEGAPLAAVINDCQDAVDNEPKLNGGSSFHSSGCSLSKLEPQQSITSENLSSAINHSFTASLQNSSSPLSLPSCRIPLECMQTNSLADGEAQLVNNLAEAAATDFKIHKQTFSALRVEEWNRSLPLESFSALAVDNFVAPSAIQFHMALEASRQLFRSDHDKSGLGPYPHHNVSSQQQISCATNRDHVSVYAPEREARYGDFGRGMSNGDEILYRERSLRSICQHIHSDDAMSSDAEKCATEAKCFETRANSTVPKDEVDYTSTEMYRMEAERKPDSCRVILREKEFAELDHEITWPDYLLTDEKGILESGLLGIDLSCENSGVYTSPFNFSAEAMDRDTCTSVLEDHLSDDSEFLLAMQFERSSSTSQSFQECVLLTEPSELDYCMSPHESSLPGPPLSPQETHSLSDLSISSSLLWKLEDTSAWDGQSSGSTETTTATDLQAGGDGAGECTSQDHEALALWSSMDLAPLCLVA